MLEIAKDQDTGMLAQCVPLGFVEFREFSPALFVKQRYLLVCPRLGERGNSKLAHCSFMSATLRSYCHRTTAPPSFRAFFKSQHR